MLADLAEPADRVLVGVSSCYVEDDECPCHALVVCPGYRLKGLGAGLERVRAEEYGVPDLKLNVASLVFDHLVTVFNADGDVVLGTEPALRKLQQQARLAHG